MDDKKNARQKRIKREQNVEKVATNGIGTPHEHQPLKYNGKSNSISLRLCAGPHHLLLRSLRVASHIAWAKRLHTTRTVSPYNLPHSKLIVRMFCGYFRMNTSTLDARPIPPLNPFNSLDIHSIGSSTTKSIEISLKCKINRFNFISKNLTAILTPAESCIFFSNDVRVR